MISLRLAKGDLARFTIQQQGFSVTIRIIDPLGRYICGTFENKVDRRTLSLIVPTAGIYRLKMIQLGPDARVTYSIQLDEIRSSNPLDLSNCAAWVPYIHADELAHRNNDALFPRVIEGFEKALELSRKAADPMGEATILHDLGSNYSARGDYRKGLDYFQKAITLARQVGSPYVEASSLTFIGENHWFLSEYDEAMDYLNQALPIWQKMHDLAGQGWVYNDIGSLYGAQGDREKALQYYHRALEVYRGDSDIRGLAVAHTALGTAYAALGVRQKALDYFLESIPEWKKRNDPMGEGRARHRIGEVYASMGDDERALDFFDQAYSLWHKVGYRYGEALALQSRGSLLIRRRQFLRAQQDLSRSLRLRRIMGDRRGEAYSLSALAVGKHSLRQDDEALKLETQAMELWTRVGDRYGESVSLTNLGEIYLVKKDYARASDFLNRALVLHRAVRDQEGEAATLFVLARLDCIQKHPLEAIEKLKVALKQVEEIRESVNIEGTRAVYLSKVQNYYDLYIDTLMQLHREDVSRGYDHEALEISERSIARSLLDSLGEARSDIREGANRELLEREQKLRRELNAKAEFQTRSLMTKATSKLLQTTAHKIDALTTELQEVRAQIRISSPRYAALTQPQPVSVEEIQQHLVDPDSVLLEFSLGDEESYLWVVSKTAFQSFRLPGRSRIESLARQTYLLLDPKSKSGLGMGSGGREPPGGVSGRNYPETARLLSRMLLGQAFPSLDAKRWMIVADGALQYIPMAALPNPRKALDPKNWEPLMVSHEIISLPSASSLAMLRQEVAHRPSPPGTVAVVADPVFDRDDPRVKSKSRIRVGSSNLSGKPGSANLHSDLYRSAFETGVSEAGSVIPRLPFAHQEAESILSLVPPIERKAALDFQANLATVRDPELGRYRIVHFATHGLLNSLHPQLSGLVLSLVKPDGAPEDGFLRLNEIYNLKLPVDLVVLSACQTGLGKEIKGEGLIGLTRGFMYAGSARVMASLWKVDDQATAELMKYFYEALLGPRHASAAEALRIAQLRMWREGRWRLPFYWAAFGIQGEW